MNNVYAIGLGIFTICAHCQYAFAQKNDYVWLSGYNSNAQPDTVAGHKLGNTKLDFNFQPVNVSFDSLSLNFDFTNVSYCTDDGQLLFYSNGIYVHNRSDELISNGFGLNDGYLDEVWDPTIQQGGYRNSQGILALNDVSNPNYYHLLYTLTDSVPGSGGASLYTSKLQMALLDMSANSGAGLVLQKNVVLIQDSLGQDIQAVRHGNGQDWWILSQKRSTNCFYELLLTKDTLMVMPDVICLGDTFINTYIGASCFTPDGSKYIYLAPAPYKGMEICDFDRCTGNLSNPQYLSMPVYDDSGWGGCGVAVSPNSRFLYVMATKQAYQFDLQSLDIFDSIDTVAIFDDFYLPFGSYFNTPQLGPDGKIYVSCGNTEADYHVINNPDAKRDSCNFVQHGVLLPSYCNSLPNFPNYRLGAWQGSACDTISGLNEVQRAAKEQILKLYPNPAADYTIIDYGYTDWSKGDVELQICNALGQTVYIQQLPMYSGFQKIDIRNFASGMYTVFIKRNNGVVASGKVVKE